MKTLINLFTVLSIFLTISCQVEEKDDPGSKATLKVMLTVAPADYEAIWIDIWDVKMQKGDDSDWQYFDHVERGIYNLLDLTDGIDTLLAQSMFESGTLTKIRLVLGNNNYLVTKEDSIYLSTPSAQQSGLKINLNQELKAGNSYMLVLNFDASKSIVKAGNSGKYILKPVLNVSIEAQNGPIAGTTAGRAASELTALSRIDSFGSYTGCTSDFLIWGFSKVSYIAQTHP